MKYYIYNLQGFPLYWNEDILEFDTYESAARFLVSAKANYQYLEDFYTDVEIRQGLLTENDDEHLNATNLILAQRGNEIELVEVNNY